MEQIPSKADGLITDGVDALRAERAAAPNTEIVISALHVPGKGRLVTTAGLALVAIVAAVLLIAPRDSVAADLRQIEQALVEMPARIETHFVIDSAGDVQESLEIHVANGQAALDPSDGATLHWSHDTLTIDHGDYATIQKARMPDWTRKTLVLREWLQNAVKGTVKRRTVRPGDIVLGPSLKLQLDPQLVIERYEFEFKILDAAGSPHRGHAKFDVEQATLRPVFVEAKIEEIQHLAIKLEYDVANIVFLELVTDTVYDIDEQRRLILESIDSPTAVADLEGTKVLLHAAVIDHEGNVTFMYSETDALPYHIDRSMVLDKSMLVDEPTLAIPPALHKGRQIAFLSVALADEHSEASSLQRVRLPVSRGGKIAWVEFHDVPLMRTGSSLALLAPENVAFFTKKNRAGQTTAPSR